METPPAADLPPPIKTESVTKPYWEEGKKSERGNGRGWILALAAMQTLGSFVMFGMQNSVSNKPAPILSLVVMLSLGVIFFGLWIWGKTAPFAALLTALIVFVSFHLLDAVIDPASLLRGIIVKVIMLTGLGTALKKAYMAKREKELEEAQSQT